MATQLPSQKRSGGQREGRRRQRDHKHYSQHVMRNKEQHWRDWFRGDDPVLIRLANIAVSAGLRWCWKNGGGERRSAGSNTTQPSLPLPRVHQNPQMSGGGTRQRPSSRVRSVCELQERKFGPPPQQLIFCIIGCSAATNIHEHPCSSAVFIWFAFHSYSPDPFFFSSVKLQKWAKG